MIATSTRPFKLLFRLTLLSCLLCFAPALGAQNEDERIAELIESYRADARGPYRGIFWFCSDGSLRAARDPCPDDADARQHADYKPEIKRLMREEDLYFGQILADTEYDAFWDAESDHSRLKQYQLNDYLVAADNGWILERARYYRGAFQVEDEEEWGRGFFRWLLDREDVLRENFYLIVQAARDIPHRGDTDLNQRIRAVSKEIADQYEPFMDLRIKIHGRPGAGDAGAVREFTADNENELRERDLYTAAETLAADIDRAYGGSGLQNIAELVRQLPTGDPLKDRLSTFVAQQEAADAVSRLTAAADLLVTIREDLVAYDRLPLDRLRLIDVVNELGDLIFRTAAEYPAETARDQMEKICYLGQAAAGTGFVELWEYDAAWSMLADPGYQYIWPRMLDDYLDNARRFVEWGTATNRATYGDVVDRYARFEPAALGFLDDQIRGSVLLPLGQAVGELGDWLARNSDSGNALMDINTQAQARGLNPGYARGTLHLIEGAPDEVEVNNRDIFVFSRPPADLKPVGGILTVSEGNPVSHVQLLARNLGIPNAVISEEQFQELLEYDGEEVFFAVSSGGTVVMKPADELSEQERELFAVKERNQERIRVPIDRLDLSTREVLNLSEVNSEDSGVRSGPKAANLGQLKELFPENVVDGLVIPFGIFREHLDQQMPGQAEGTSYWQFLNDRFAEAARMEEAGRSEREVEAYTLEQLATLRNAIDRIELSEHLLRQLDEGFRNQLGGDFGEVPVFLRSDTNMEDLAEFTGAGLNKTVFNVVDREGIIEGIKEVWASPYTERSYRWRQRYLLNPENVFPSILIIPSVDVAYSGVMITKGVSNGNDDDITVAFSRGAGGAVDGQAAESYLIDRYGSATLQAPARERMHRRLPVTGGSVMVPAAFNERILTDRNLRDLYELGQRVERIMPKADGMEDQGPFDVELGFQDDKIWLFQIRPFVENDQAQSSEYLQGITPPDREGVYIDLGSRLDVGPES
ncbi:pyruvate phosphate dikinase-like enzyme [Neolewinella xylanilytica]|uniref:Phosphoenolpyruvate synthase n=1 Tax=Neolewinella xylanilytica TaxID=1514080 RepID=A0A2S6I639_9BACT|nr:PEP/pyruvate-binding domain-containing protein [Neolewinella xylanilytica]PPK86638.1 pyruvate phosphate dikinase-like enzyme [Neolewinella xylanilytica]